MRIEDEFKVGVPKAQAWAVLLDVERIAPCLPGAQLQEVEGDEYRGLVKVKVGPITAQYKGAARITESDEATGTVVLRAEGRDTRGQGTAAATITATLADDGEGTLVRIATDLDVTGKVAQFGRGVMADVSAKLLKQFVTNLERDVLAGSGSPAAPAAHTPAASTSEDPAPAPAAPAAPAAGAGSTVASGALSSGVRTIDSPEPEPIDLLGTAGGAVVRRVAGALAGLVAFAWLRRRMKRRRARRG